MVYLVLTAAREQTTQKEYMSLRSLCSSLSLHSPTTAGLHLLYSSASRFSKLGRTPPLSLRRGLAFSASPQRAVMPSHWRFCLPPPVPLSQSFTTREHRNCSLRPDVLNQSSAAAERRPLSGSEEQNYFLTVQIRQSRFLCMIVFHSPKCKDSVLSADEKQI